MEHILFFFDVPIYRLPPETYYAEREHHVQAQMYGGNAQNVALLKGFDERNSSIGGFFREHLEKSYGGPWDFNEIVGYIRLHFVGSQVRGGALDGFGD